MPEPHSDPVAESRRLIGAAQRKGVAVRTLGGVAVSLQAPEGRPLLPRAIKDIDLVAKKGTRTAVTQVLVEEGYVADKMFNVLHGSRRLLFYDEPNQRKLDVFVGEFSMCHPIPIADRLDKDPLTVPLAELLLTKLQIVELTERDQRDIYNLAYHHEVTAENGTGIEGRFVAELCSRDWGLWRTSRGTIERCLTNVVEYDLDAGAVDLIKERLRRLWEHIDKAPKSAKWKLRARVGDRVKWYEEPEEDAGQA